ncbi:DUF512 domain-containing protein [Oscillospiraceae bacterium PP1C4]
MPVLIQSVASGSYAQRAGIRSGDTLVSIGENQINDVLDYRFYMTERSLMLKLFRSGAAYSVNIKKGEYDDLGLEFETYLMDRQLACKNKCVFCFVDQMPKGMRKTLYFKDDDSRMSFLFGNYITLTNLTDADVDRIIKMRISPVNISVHTTDPQLRVKMMKNPHAGDSLRYIKKLCEAGIKVNTQLVLCPSWNDGEALERSLSDLGALYPNLQSIACVPVGLTRFRERLAPLVPYEQASAAETVDRIHRFSEKMFEKYGERVAYPSDEFFLKAELPIPAPSYYGDFDQLEDGVGVIAMLRDEFESALSLDDEQDVSADIAIATGEAAGWLMQELAGQVMARHPGVKIAVYTIVNHFFGEHINVAGLITGTDLVEQLAGKCTGKRLLLPSVMLRHEGDCFLDDMTVEAVEQSLGVSIQTIDNDGYQLYDAMIGKQ